MSSWSISVRTVGNQRQPPQSLPTAKADAKETSISSATSAAAASTSSDTKPQPKDFVLDVDPDSPLSTLQNQIENLTGLKPQQQRLIYRGRLITGDKKSEEMKISDVDGLGDGQTIHLVPRPLAPTTTSTETPQSSSRSSPDPTFEEGVTASGNSTASLLATLLGLGMSNAFSTSLDSEEDGATPTTADQRRRIAPLLRRQRRTARGSQTIPPRPDPGALEPVRQSLMTIHTMLHHSRAEERKWYKGQWLDCRDTVNQWLEATVVDIVCAQDILTAGELEAATVAEDRIRGKREAVASEEECRLRGKRKHWDSVVSDPVISANDYDGRKRLFLETDESTGEMKLRDGGCHDVQLLLIHYNGWPHRWDEWIRSDSERIRTFRTRTRHGPMAPYASPTPQHVFQAAPTTYIRTDDESDRPAILPELSRTIYTVLNQLNSVVYAPLFFSPTQPHLPWLLEEETSSSPSYDQGRLNALAPLLDRLGRALTDVAPHVSALASSLDQKSESRDEGEETTSEPPTRPIDSSSTRTMDSSSPTEIPESFDYVNGLVHAFRENRRDGLRPSPTPREGTSAGASNILGTILSASGDDASNTLGRILRTGGGDGGIDIHIHAIVTPTAGLAAMGGNPAGLGFAMQPSATFRARSSEGDELDNGLEGAGEEVEEVLEEDDDGLFSELYSEGPPPLIPGGGSEESPPQPSSSRPEEDPDINANNDTSPPSASAQENDMSSELQRYPSISTISTTNSRDSNSRRPSALLGRFLRRALGRRDPEA